MEEDEKDNEDRADVEEDDDEGDEDEDVEEEKEEATPGLEEAAKAKTPLAKTNCASNATPTTASAKDRSWGW